MSDLISREEAIEAISTKGCDEREAPLAAAMMNVRQWVVDILDSLPSVEPVHKPDYSYEADMVKRLRQAYAVQGEWIPVSERLPEPSCERLLVSGYIKIGGLKYFSTDMARWNGDDWTFDGKPIPEIVVLAWMPMPEPYKGGDTESEDE